MRAVAGRWMVRESRLLTLGKFVFVNITHPSCTTGLCDPSSACSLKTRVHPEVAWCPPQNSLQLFISGSCFPALSLWVLIEPRIQVECGLLVMVCPGSKTPGVVPWAGRGWKHASPGGCNTEKPTTQMLTIPTEKWKAKLLSWVSLFATSWAAHSIFPGQITGVGSLSLLQRLFPTQGSNPGLLHCRRILYQLSHKESPRILERVAYPFSTGSSRPRNRTGVSCIAGGFFTNWAIRETHIRSMQLVWHRCVWSVTGQNKCFMS